VKPSESIFNHPQLSYLSEVRPKAKSFCLLQRFCLRNVYLFAAGVFAGLTVAMELEKKLAQRELVKKYPAG